MDPSEKLTYALPGTPPLKRAVIRGVEWVFGQRRIVREYEHAMRDGGAAFFGHGLETLKVDLRYDRAALDAIPAEGPVILIANHPFGVVDGIIACWFALQRREHFKVLIHKALTREERLIDFMLPIDFDATREAARFNIQSRKEAVRYLKEGGLLIVFPAGGISTATGAPWGPVDDLEWATMTARLVQESQATVVPVFFDGQNSVLFQLVSTFSLTLRLSMVIREINNKRNQVLRIAIGAPIPFADLAGIKNRKDLTAELRKRVYALRNQLPD